MCGSPLANQRPFFVFFTRICMAIDQRVAQRSALITQGFQRTPNRAMLRAVGFGDEDFTKPIIGVANGYSNLSPCNVGLDRLADCAMEALRSAGTMPQVF